MATSSFGDRCRMTLLCLKRHGIIKDVRCHIVKHYVRPRLFDWDSEQMRAERGMSEGLKYRQIVKAVRKHIEYFEQTPEQDLSLAKITRIRLAVGGSEVPLFYDYWHWL